MTPDQRALLKAARQNPKCRAPYARVPVEDIILPSPLADRMDHSSPVEDAICGRIRVRWTAETPLLVGGTGDAANDPFRLGEEGPYALPGASLRGMLRSVLEIASFGRLTFYDDYVAYTRNIKGARWKHRIASGSRDPIVGRTGAPHPRAQGGWLFKSGNQFALIPADTRIYEIKVLVEAMSCDVMDWHAANLHERLNKLRAAGRNGLRPISAFIDQPDDPDAFAMLAVSGHTPEEGLPGKPNEKRTEALFISREAVPVPVNEGIGTRFLCSLHRDGNRHTKAPTALFDALLHNGPSGFDCCDVPLEMQYKDIARYGLPVFWRNPGQAPSPRNKPNGKEIILSLTALMRVPYEKSLEDVAQKTQPRSVQDAFDLTQGLFGWAPPGKDDDDRPVHCRPPQEQALRSRVQVGFALSEDAMPENNKRIMVAAKPSPSFWPFYLSGSRSEQEDAPMDYDNPKVRLAGRKRYPARHHGNGAFTGLLPQSSNDNEAVKTKLRFLKSGATFEGELRVHNLSLVECGALLWAIRLGQRGRDKGARRHMLGRARAWGYGQLKCEILEQSLVGAVTGDTVNENDAMTAFEAWVERGVAEKRGDAKTTPFAELDPIQRLLGTTDPRVGAAVKDALGFPETPGDDPVLKGYAGLKSAAEENGTVILPRYPGPIS